MGVVIDMPAASSVLLKPGAILMNALLIEPTKSPNAGTAVPMLRNHPFVPVMKSAKAGKPRYRFTVRSWIKFGYATNTNPTAIEMKMSRTIRPLLTEAREEDSRRDT